MRTAPERRGGRRFSPMLPTVVNCALGVLWAFSALAGWGVTAFCGVAEVRDPDCADVYTVVSLVSMVPAGAAVLMVLLAWALPGVRHRPERMDGLLLAALPVWVAAGLVLFLGGLPAQG